MIELVFEMSLIVIGVEFDGPGRPLIFPRCELNVPYSWCLIKRDVLKTCCWTSHCLIKLNRCSTENEIDQRSRHLRTKIFILISFPILRTKIEMSFIKTTFDSIFICLNDQISLWKRTQDERSINWPLVQKLDVNVDQHLVKVDFLILYKRERENEETMANGVITSSTDQLVK